MVIAIVFLLGVCNFALHKAVLESGHPLLRQTRWFVHMLNGRVSLMTEFLLLLAALLFVANGAPYIGIFYFIYSGFNAVAAWIILTGRV